MKSLFSSAPTQPCRLLGGLSPSQFLAEYWQKKPLLIRGAIPDFKDPLSRDELAGLAMEAGVRSRLVWESSKTDKAKGKKPWRLEHGPFSEKKLRSLPQGHWALLVSEVDRLLDAGALLLDHFRFIPNWRLDDLMVSFAPPGGGVGPHIDSYDVFLLQGLGTRRWGVQTKPSSALIPGLDLRILKSFVPDAEWVLQSGDMLYVPPGVAHHGVALSECMTYSVGFRAPAKKDLVDAFFRWPTAFTTSPANEKDDDLYTDEDLLAQDHPGALSPQAVAKFGAMMRAAMEQPGVLGRWFSAYLTRMGAAEGEAEKKPLSKAQLLKLLSSGRLLWRSEDVRMLYYAPVTEPTPRTSEFYFFCGGHEAKLPLALLPLAEFMTDARCFSTADLQSVLPNGTGAKAQQLREQALELVRFCLQHGALRK